MRPFPLFSGSSSSAAFTAGTSDGGAEHGERAGDFFCVFDGL